MPEEINRLITDQIADILWVHSEEALRNLELKGFGLCRAHFVGNTMIDSLVALQDRFLAEPAAGSALLAPTCWSTLHRPALVDGPCFSKRFPPSTRCQR